MTQIDFAPVGDHVIVRPKNEEEVTKSGIVIAFRDSVNKEMPQCGEVIAVGGGGTFPDCPDPSKVFSIGDFVYFNRYAGLEIVFGEEKEKLIVLRLDAIFGKLINGKQG